MTDLEICEAVCLYCPMRFSCTLDPCMCADCQDYLDDIENEDSDNEQCYEKTDKS